MYFSSWINSEMKYVLLLTIFILATSCQFFETEKISSETFYDEELKTIDWKEVDQYPVFKACESLSEKKEQKICFEKTLSMFLFEAVSNNKDVSIHSLHDTIHIQFSISEEGKLTVKNIDMDSLTKAELPRLEERLINKIDSISLTAPAYKRGIPVKTKFTLPIVLQTDDPL